MIDDALLEAVRSDGSAIELERACWLVWPQERRSGVSAAMISAQFVHLNAPVLAVQRNGRMEYFDAEGNLGWTSNLPWPRANLEMARLPARADFWGEPSPEENPSEGNPSEENPPEKDSSDGNAPGQDVLIG